MMEKLQKQEMLKGQEKVEKFAIRCPNCLEWTEYDFNDSPISQPDEIRTFLNNPNSDLGKKVITCSSPEWICPNNFRAIITNCSNVNKYYDFDIPENCLEPVKIFRLYKNQYDTERFSDFHGLLFSGCSLKRQKHILLHQLFDRDLLSKTLRGVSEQIKKPVTIYAAQIYELSRSTVEKLKLGVLDIRKNKQELWANYENIELVCWVPIEAYTDVRELIPVNYNASCSVIRKTTVKLLKVRKANKSWTQENCELKNKGVCGLVKPFCEKGRDQDYNQCLIYLRERLNYDPCYGSDIKLISEVYHLWKEHKLVDKSLFRCQVIQLHEKVRPIIVHGHMVGAVFTGQIDCACKERNDAEENGKINKSGEMGFVENFIKTRIQFPEDNPDYATFINDLNTIKIDDIIEEFSSNVKKIESLANTRYIHFRTRWEELFRIQLTLWIRKNSKEGKNNVLKRVLKDMSEFWAFDYLVLIRVNTELRKFEYYSMEDSRRFDRGPDSDVLFDKNAQNDTLLYDRSWATVVENLFDQSDNPTVHPYVKKIKKLLLDLKCVPESYQAGDHLIVNIPSSLFVAKTLYPTFFVFSGRQLDKVSPLRQKSPFIGISPLCKEFTRETCIAVIRELESSSCLIDKKYEVEPVRRQ